MTQRQMLNKPVNIFWFSSLTFFILFLLDFPLLYTYFKVILGNVSFINLFMFGCRSRQNKVHVWINTFKSKYPPDHVYIFMQVHVEYHCLHMYEPWIYSLAIYVTFKILQFIPTVFFIKNKLNCKCTLSF